MSSVCGQSFYDNCDAQYPNVAPSASLADGETVAREIGRNETHRWTYSNYDLNTMQLEDEARKLVITLEPCSGVVYLFVRKNIPCHPDPYSCIDLDAEERDASKCRRTHFMSVIDGTKDGAPTVFQISLSSTRYFISVFAAEDSTYELTVLDNVGAYPRRGNSGLVSAGPGGPGEVKLQWSVPSYFPEGVAMTRRYLIYSAMLLPEDNVTSDAVFLRPAKILNTYCGLKLNAPSEYDVVDAALCDTLCNTTVTGLQSDTAYAFNVVAESTLELRVAYSGATSKTSWTEVTQVDVGRRLLEAASVPMDRRDLQVIGAVSGSVIGMVGFAGMVLVKFSS